MATALGYRMHSCKKNEEIKSEVLVNDSVCEGLLFTWYSDDYMLVIFGGRCHPTHEEGYLQQNDERQHFLETDKY